MKSGQILKEFDIKDGRRILLRTPRWEDLDGLLDLINSAVEEEAEISRDEKVSRDDELEWLSGLLVRLEKDKTFLLVGEADGKIMASADITRQHGYSTHVGVVGILVGKGFRGLGVGTAIMHTLMEEAKKLGLTVLELTAFESNKRAIHVYQKIGFVQTGKVPKKHLKHGEFIDEVIMTKLLE